MSAGTVVSFASNLHGIPVARGNFHRQSQVGTNWNEVRMGFLGTIIPSSGSDGTSTAEVITVGSYLDWLCFGLMNTRANSSVIPGNAASNFIGLALGTVNADTVSIDSNASANGNLLANNSHNRLMSINGATVISAGSDQAFGLQVIKYSATVYAIAWLIRLVVTNKGLSNQVVTASCSIRPSSATAITQATATPVLRTAIMNATYSGSTALNWFASGAALPLPDCWFFRLPFYNNCLRISAYIVELIS